MRLRGTPPVEGVVPPGRKEASRTSSSFCFIFSSLHSIREGLCCLLLRLCCLLLRLCCLLFRRVLAPFERELRRAARRGRLVHPVRKRPGGRRQPWPWPRPRPRPWPWPWPRPWPWPWPWGALGGLGSPGGALGGPVLPWALALGPGPGPWPWPWPWPGPGPGPVALLGT